jgi:hypothetical protein
MLPTESDVAWLANEDALRMRRSGGSGAAGNDVGLYGVYRATIIFPELTGQL